MLVDCTGNIRLVDDAQQILQRDCQQARACARQETHDRIKAATFDTAAAQNLVERAQRLPASVVALACGVAPGPCASAAALPSTEMQAIKAKTARQFL